MKTITALLLLLASTVWLGCKNDAQDGSTSEAAFTCPMHPSVRSATPGSCPVCNMSLVRVEVNKDTHEGKHGNFVTLTPRQQVLAGIELDTVRMHDFTAAAPMLGRVVVDERSRGEIRSRFNGRIEKLLVRTSGTSLAKGEPVCTIYSEQLLADSKFYLSLLKRMDSLDTGRNLIVEMVAAARRNLLEAGMAEKEILAMEMQGTAAGTLTVFADRGGYVEEVPVKEGGYVGKGEALLSLVDLSYVWVEVQVYPYQHRPSSKSGVYEIDPGDGTNTRFQGTWVAENPALVDGKKFLLMKLSVRNANGRLLPGMMVRVGAQTLPEPALAIPKSALVLDQMKSVWILAHANTFEQRMITTGKDDGRWIEVTNGLQAGEVVVSDGAYLINSEFILKQGASKRHQH